MQNNTLSKPESELENKASRDCKSSFKKDIFFARLTNLNLSDETCESIWISINQ